MLLTPKELEVYDLDRVNEALVKQQTRQVWLEQELAIAIRNQTLLTFRLNRLRREAMEAQNAR